MTKNSTSGLNWNEMIGLLTRLKKDKKIREYLFVGIGCYMGLRASDLLKLKWIDLLNCKELEITEKKTGKNRLITINPNLQDVLKDSTEYYQRKGMFDPNSYIFQNRWGQKISIQYMNKTLKKIFASYKIRVKKASTHTLRKTFGKRVWDMDNGSERALIYLSQIFSHSNTAVTRRYIGIVQEDIENIYLNL
jgi:integrase